MDTARRFFTDWGLRRTYGGKTRTVFETREKCQIILRPRAAKDLPKAIQRGNTLREAVWGVTSKRHLTAIANELSRDREVTVAKDGTVRSTDPMGLGIAFRVGRRKPVRMKRSPVNLPGQVERVDARSAFYPKADPIRIGRLVVGLSLAFTLGANARIVVFDLAVERRFVPAQDRAHQCGRRSRGDDAAIEGLDRDSRPSGQDVVQMERALV